MMRTVVLMALLASPALSFAGGNLLVNGSFESPGVAPDSTSTFTGGVAGWQIDTSAGLRIKNGTAPTNLAADRGYVTAVDGVNYALLGFSGNDSISQSINNLTVGQTYTMSLSYSLDKTTSPWTSNSVANSELTFGYAHKAANGSIVNDLYSLVDVHQTDHWVTVKQSVLATDSTMKFVFSSDFNPDGSGVYLDNVTLAAAVPEPETYALMTAGLAGVVLAARGRKRS